MHRRHGLRLLTADILVGKKRVKHLRGRALKHRFALHGLPLGRFKLTVSIRAVRGGKRVVIRDSRFYSRCKHKRTTPHKHRRKHKRR